MQPQFQKMQQMLGMMRKAIQDYSMLSDGDRVLIGVSGGKDSVVLLTGLALLREFIGIDYSLEAITLDPGFSGVRQDYSPIATLCETLSVPYRVREADIGEIVFNIRKEPNPCSLCARMRRGALHDAARALGCNKVALGHHADDAAETFIMNLFNEGRVGCFSPVTYLSRKDLFVIRPLVLARERDVIHAQRVCALPVVKSLCPADHATTREWTKGFLKSLERESPGVIKRILGAMQRGDVSDWGSPRPPVTREDFLSAAENGQAPDKP